MNANTGWERAQFWARSKLPLLGSADCSSGACRQHEQRDVQLHDAHVPGLPTHPAAASVAAGQASFWLRLLHAWAGPHL